MAVDAAEVGALASIHKHREPACRANLGIGQQTVRDSMKKRSF
jgi:hypothetical protein